MKNIYIKNGELNIDRIKSCYNIENKKRAIQALNYDLKEENITVKEYEYCLQLIDTDLEQILKLSNEVITLEELAKIEESEVVEMVEDCGMSGKNGKHWYCVKLNAPFINESRDDVSEIQVYTD